MKVCENKSNLELHLKLNWSLGPVHTMPKKFLNAALFLPHNPPRKRRFSFSRGKKA